MSSNRTVIHASGINSPNNQMQTEGIFDTEQTEMLCHSL
jgi:hypothetical protein